MTPYGAYRPTLQRHGPMLSDPNTSRLLEDEDTQSRLRYQS